MRTTRFLLLAGAMASFLPLAACATADLQKGLQTANEVCVILQADGPIFLALADANGVPVPVSGKAATALAADCAAVGAVAASVPPPAGAAVQTVTLPPKPG